jgi:S1-C subfamily serine protease
VRIESIGVRGLTQGVGSGILIEVNGIEGFQEKVVVVTNAHVAAVAKKTQISLRDGRSFEVEVVEWTEVTSM